MSTFQDSLNKFVNDQKGKTPQEVQANTQQFSSAVQEYAPKERWGNVFKWTIGYALAIGLGHALAAAITRGAKDIAPKEVEVEPLANAIEEGRFNSESFGDFMTTVVCVQDVDLGDIQAIDTAPEGITLSESVVSGEVSEASSFLDVMNVVTS
jgi:hypothetical protein